MDRAARDGTLNRPEIAYLNLSADRRCHAATSMRRRPLPGLGNGESEVGDLRYARGDMTNADHDAQRGVYPMYSFHVSSRTALDSSMAEMNVTFGIGLYPERYSGATACITSSPVAPQPKSQSSAISSGEWSLIVSTASPTDRATIHRPGRGRTSMHRRGSSRCRSRVSCRASWPNRSEVSTAVRQRWTPCTVKRA